MQFTELEVQIKKVSADLQALENEMRAKNPLYQRLMGQYDILVLYHKKEQERLALEEKELKAKDKPNKKKREKKDAKNDKKND